MNKRSVALILILFFISINVDAQSPLIGNWKGVITYMGDTEDDNFTRNIKLNIVDSETAELLIEDGDSKNYIPFRRYFWYSKFRINQIFRLSGNFAYLIISKRSDKGNGQEILNIYFQEDVNKVSFVLSNLTLPYGVDNYVLATGELENEDKKTYSGSRLLVGGQSYNYIKIESIEKGKNSTFVTLKILNNTDLKIEGTVHEPGNATAFYITNADRSKKYKLISADKKLPLSISVKPGGYQNVKLEFEAIPPGMNLMNIFEGGPPEATNLWKFYDVRLKD